MAVSKDSLTATVVNSPINLIGPGSGDLVFPQQPISNNLRVGPVGTLKEKMIVRFSQFDYTEHRSHPLPFLIPLTYPL